MQRLMIDGCEDLNIKVYSVDQTPPRILPGLNREDHFYLADSVDIEVKMLKDKIERLESTLKLLTSEF